MFTPGLEQMKQVGIQHDGILGGGGKGERAPVTIISSSISLDSPVVSVGSRASSRGSLCRPRRKSQEHRIC